MEVAKAKEDAYRELYKKLDTKDGEKDLYRLAKQSRIEQESISNILEQSRT